jgi:hypothetical protein
MWPMDADALLIRTSWQQLRASDIPKMEARMLKKFIEDERNLYQPDRLTSEDWTYFCIG